MPKSKKFKMSPKRKAKVKKTKQKIKKGARSAKHKLGTGFTRLGKKLSK